jgi:glutathione S-transferase
VLIAFYESEIAFESCIVDLGDEKSRADFEAIWPIGKFPVLRDDMRGRTVPESSIIIEYLAQNYPGRARLVPSDADLALRTRSWDRARPSLA